MAEGKNGTLKVGLVFPVWVPDESTLKIVKSCYEKLTQIDGLVIRVMIDGPHDDEVTGVFPEATIYEKNSGITRSWNDGADALFCGANCDVVILGNQDAYPASPGDLWELATSAHSLKDLFFAMGPLTNRPGHIHHQKAHGPQSIIPGAVRPIDGINGFTWAISRYNWLVAIENRRNFLCGDPRKIYDYGKREIFPWNGDRRKSLAMVAQEDELFHWADRELEKQCGINQGCFWWHYKLALFRKPEYATA